MKYTEDFIIWLFENCSLVSRTDFESTWVHYSDNALDSNHHKNMAEMWEYWSDNL